MFVSCEKPFIPSDVPGTEVIPDTDDDNPDVQLRDTLIAENDTARFYLSATEIKGVTLMMHPTPSLLITDPRYRLPRKSEVSAVLKNVDMPAGYWRSRQRILCRDDVSGGYYTYVPHGNITQAGYKTEYCILPIRTEHKNGQTGHVDIEVNDEWE